MTKAAKKPATKAAASKPAAKATKTAPAAAAAAAPTKLGKTELTDVIATNANLSKKDAAAAMGAMLDAVASALKAGQTVGLPGVGTLAVKATSARTGVRPGTSEKIEIPAGKKVSFKVATDLKKNL
ncbi:HU family DNA-binding protein [Deinococcus sonorensis]|uniref:HU family DNA-binding protein n=1 Tax=Deinococcus sonorensis TaxID=309891 RepID=A0ABV8YC57_9DEIO